MKIKKHFLKIMASLVASVLLTLAAVVPASAKKGYILGQIFSMNISAVNDWLNSKSALGSDEVVVKIRGILKNCQKYMVDKINSAVDKDWGKHTKSIKFGKYRLSKDCYSHIIYGDYSNGIHCGGLHSEKGLDVLRSSLGKFRKKVSEYLENREKQLKNNANYDVKFRRVLAQMKMQEGDKKKSTNDPKKKDVDKITSLREWFEKGNVAAYDKLNDSKMPNLKEYKLNFSDVDFIERHLFPRNWSFDNFKEALISAVKQKEKNCDKRMSSSCTINDPVNPEQKIKVKLIVRYGRIVSFHPDDGKNYDDENYYDEEEESEEEHNDKNENSDSESTNDKMLVNSPLNVKPSVFYPKNYSKTNPNSLNGQMNAPDPCNGQMSFNGFSPLAGQWYTLNPLNCQIANFNPPKG